MTAYEQPSAYCGRLLLNIQKWISGSEPQKERTMFEQLSAMIPRRRSVRSYLPEPVDEAMLAEVRAFMEALTPLIPGERPVARIIPTVQASFLQKWKNPQFLAFYCVEGEDALINVGFMYQQLDLYLQSLGLGTCWVGLGWPDDKLVPPPEGMKLAVMMAFGYPDGVALRNAADFKRNAAENIADVPDERLEPARLAPSATNSQPWHFVHDGEVLHVYREELGLIKKRTHGRMNLIDMGIMLAHLHVTNPQTFRFFRTEGVPAPQGRLYVGSVQFTPVKTGAEL